MAYTFSPHVDGVDLQIRVAPGISTDRDILYGEHPHKHYFIEFHYMYEGEERLTFLEEGRELILKKGELVMIPREVYHTAEVIPGKTAKRLCFDFNLDPSENSANVLCRLFRELREVAVLKEKYITDAMERCLTVFENETEPLYEERLGTILLDVVWDVFRRFAPEKRGTPLTDRLRSRQRWLIDEHIGCCYHLPNGLEVLAEKLYLSHRQTRKLILQFYGTGYKELILKERMSMACLLLRSTALPLEEIAEKVGYSSYSGFHIAFTKTMGATPGNYRKNKQE